MTGGLRRSDLVAHGSNIVAQFLSTSPSLSLVQFLPESSEFPCIELNVLTRIVMLNYTL